ncbi:uncharacterized protein LOC131946508 [Physella acuta]|uniref:uncharacterized protein LOC131946508 n=1 Tax=Physella acuta TaxID=109671 RepID=UPI0027DEA800|nr:uncharacterized protein LOC131946508 [Physella acuta]
MEDFPVALIIASRESVGQNNNVLYRLVRTLPDGSGVESIDRLVNVVPHRRTYRMERKKEIDDFRHEILRRPLILQPVLHFGRGLGHNCGACYNDEPWVVMVNQTHPKVLSRLQMGLDLAKGAIDRGQSVEIRFQFGALIQRVYREHLRQKEMNEALESSSGLDDCLLHFRYAEWDHCDLVIRYHGYAATFKKNMGMFELPNLEFLCKFEDIGMHEMEWSQYNGQKFPKPHLAPVTEDEIRALLPQWTINGVSPLTDIGEAVPEHNYSYAQAGRLYESFRKKKRQRNPPNREAGPSSAHYDSQSADQHADDLELKGAVGYDSNVHPEHLDDYDYSDGYYNPRNDQHDMAYGYANAAHKVDRYYDSGVEDEHSVDWQRPRENKQSAPPRRNQPQKPTQPAVTDKYGHINANVEIKAPDRYQNVASGKLVNSHYDRPSRPGINGDDHMYEVPLKKQDSDRSSRSTNADSGYSPDTDGQRSREDSYDYNDQSYMTRSKHDLAPLKNYVDPHVGLENPAFSHDNQDALQKHKEFVAKMRQQQNGGNPPVKPKRTVHSNGLQSPTVLSPKDLLNIAEKSMASHDNYSDQHNRTGKIAESFI